MSPLDPAGVLTPPNVVDPGLVQVDLDESKDKDAEYTTFGLGQTGRLERVNSPDRECSPQ